MVLAKKQRFLRFIGCTDCGEKWLGRCMVCKKVAYIWCDEKGIEIPKSQITDRAKEILRRVTCDDIVLSNARFMGTPPKKRANKKKLVLAVQDGFIVEKEVLTKQPLPITMDNFHIATRAEFIEISEVPEGYELFFSSRGSEYYRNADSTVVVRKSDHWGLGIKYCDWFLKGYEQAHCGKWKKIVDEPTKIGMIAISKFRPKMKFND